MFRLLEPTVFWERSLSEGLSRSDWSMRLSVVECLHCFNVGRPSPLWAAPFHWFGLWIS